MQPKPPRPTGVTILAILAILGGIAGLLAGFTLIGVGILVGTLLASEVSNQLTIAGYPGLAGLDVGVISAIVIVLGVVVLILGILYLGVGIGFFGGKGWAWTLGVIVSVIGLVLAIVQIAVGNFGSILSLLIGALILYYLMRPHVKAFFGKGPPMGAMASPGTMTGMSTGTMGPTMGSMVKCPHCGANVAPGTTKCPSCGGTI